MRTHRFTLSVIAMGALVLTTAAPHAQQSKGRTHDVYVTITDKAGAPAKDVAVADVAIREDNQDREVLAVAPAKTPVRIALLVDTSQVTQSAVTEIRLGTAGFINAILKANPDSQISLWTFGDRPTLSENFTSAGPNLTRAVNRIFPASGSGAYLTDAIVEASGTLRRESAARQAIVAFVDETGAEFSNAGRTQALDALRLANASLWVVSLQNGGQNNTTQEGRDRSSVIDEGTSGTGGKIFTIMNRISLPQRMTEVAALLTNQTQITYGRPDQMIPPKKIDVTLLRKDLKLQAPRWAGQ